MRLVQSLDLSAAAPLWFSLVGLRGAPIDLDASGVERLGGLCAQVLLAAQAGWRADGVAFRIQNPSATFVDSARLMAVEQLLSQGGD